MVIPQGPLGIDVSAYQANVDWKAVADAGVQFVYIRALEGITPDALYAKHYDGARGAGLLVGFYQFFRPRHPSKELADCFLELMQYILSNDPWMLPPAIDVEADDKVSPEPLTKQIQEWVAYVDKAIGLKTVIYGGPGFWDSRVLHDHGLGDHRLWLADYNAKPHTPIGWTAWDFWQFTEAFKVNGIASPVDASVFGGSSEELRHLVGIPE